MPHYILFSGHLIDKPGRPIPRFPAPKEAKASEAIRYALEKVRSVATAPGAAVSAASASGAQSASAIQGIAAAACGGDILFHEACRDLHIPSEIYLGLPVNAFEETSVRACGPGWTARYELLIDTLPVHVLLPGGAADTGPEIWQKANEWMLKAALAQGAQNLTVIALWDGDTGKTGGTSQMVRAARAHQANIEIIDVRSL